MCGFIGNYYKIRGGWGEFIEMRKRMRKKVFENILKFIFLFICGFNKC